MTMWGLLCTQGHREERPSAFSAEQLPPFHQLDYSGWVCSMGHEKCWENDPELGVQH